MILFSLVPVPLNLFKDFTVAFVASLLIFIVFIYLTHKIIPHSSLAVVVHLFFPE